MIQLTGSAPNVSNLALYSGVSTVIVRFGAAVTLAMGSGVDVAGVAAGVCVVVAGPDPTTVVGAGDAAGWVFCGCLIGGKK